ncbi:MAG: YfiT family bacillithiol transferase [bacterium]
MMVTAEERRSAIAKIRVLPEQAEAAVKGLSEKQLDTPYGEDKWTPRQVIHHLADSRMNAIVRVKLILTEDHPTLKPYDQEEWAKTQDASGPVDSSLAILKGLHARWSAWMESAPESAWARSAYHPENGEMRLDDLLKVYAKHGESHVGQITALRARNGW